MRVMKVLLCLVIGFLFFSCNNLFFPTSQSDMHKIGVFAPDPDYEYAPETILIDSALTVRVGPSWDPKLWDQLEVYSIEPYRIGKYELTNLQYYQFVLEGGYNTESYWSKEGWQAKIDSGWTGPKFWGTSIPPWLDDPYSHHENTPVHGISFYEAEAYCSWLSENTGLSYGIPTTAQWERASKGPDPGYKYTWGNEYAEGIAHYIFYGYESLPDLLPVNCYEIGKSQDGCYNMIGNAYELAEPYIHFQNNEVVKVIYSRNMMPISDVEEIKKVLTTTAYMVFGAYERFYGVGVRICRNY